ncbi:MAG: nitroreductase [Lachnospiraceae bacterium]|nr:nitroreductase [Lachnospiraceae bacterium]
MNEVLKAIEERRAIRKFKPDMVPQDKIDTIIRAGLYAPSGMGKQSPIIVAITNKAIRDRLSEMNRKIAGRPEGFDPFYGGPVVLAVLADKSIVTHVHDGSLVIGNMMLAAHSLGLGSIWIHRAQQEFECEEGIGILKALGIEGDYEGIGHCVLGYIDGEVPKAAPRKEGRVFYAR